MTAPYSRGLPRWRPLRALVLAVGLGSLMTFFLGALAVEAVLTVARPGWWRRGR